MGFLSSPLEAEHQLAHHWEVADLHQEQIGHDRGSGPPVVALQPDEETGVLLVTAESSLLCS